MLSIVRGATIKKEQERRFPLSFNQTGSVIGVRVFRFTQMREKDNLTNVMLPA